MTSLTAAELRRQKILQNREERIKLLIGVKNGETNSSSLSSPSSSESLTKLNSSIETASPNPNNNNNNNSNKPFATPKLSIHEENRDFLSTETNENNDDDEIFAPSEKRRDSRSKSLRFLNFNGHTNVEILILSSLALLTCLSLHFKIDYIYRNALLPFFTFELAHLIVHLKYLPSMSSQFQVFRTLLQLCGISPKSRNNLMIFINFLYILIDNFVIYIFSFVCIFFFMDLSRRIYL